MHLEGEQAFDAPVDEVWEATFDPEILEACIPGAERVEQLSETVYEGEVKRGLASITVTMDIELEIVQDERPDRVTAHLEGSDNRTNSTAEGDIHIDVEPDGDGTLLTYEADIHFTGTLASLGGMLIKRQINKDLQTFFESLEETFD